MKSKYQSMRMAYAPLGVALVCHDTLLAAAGMAERKIRYVDIDEQQMRQFRANAAAALSRRDTGFFTENWLAAIELTAIAGTGLVGLHWLGWSGQGALAAMLVGVWASVAADLLKYLLAYRAVQQMARHHNDDAQVWAVANALADGETRYREDHGGGYRPGLGLFVDLCFGGIATVVIAHSGGLTEWSAWQALLAHPEWRWVLIGLVWWQLMTAALATARHAWLGERAGPIRFQAGARGLGLFLLMFATLMFFEENTNAAGAVMTVANLCLLVLAAISVPGIWLLQREKRWLREWMSTDDAGQGREIRHNPRP